MEKNYKRNAKAISLKVLLIAVLFLVSLFIFCYIADEAVLEHEDAFDANVHNFIAAHLTAGIINLMRSVTFFGSSYFLFPAYVVILALLLIRKKFRCAIDIGIVAITSFLFMTGLKPVFHRKRPDMPIINGITSFSFPSGHALSSFIFCGIVAYLVWKGRLSRPYKVLLTVLLFLFTLFIGLSRLVLNVHYATDVIGGYCLGVMLLIASFAIISKVNERPSHTL